MRMYKYKCFSVMKQNNSYIPWKGHPELPKTSTAQLLSMNDSPRCASVLYGYILTFKPQERLSSHT